MEWNAGSEDISEEQIDIKKARFSGKGPDNACSPFDNGLQKNPIELKAFGLEDRADAVITNGNKNWSLSNLNRWRNELSRVNTLHSTGSTNSNTNNNTSTKEFLKQRQKEYRRQMMMKDTGSQ
jgi:hypothetical protein